MKSRDEKQPGLIVDNLVKNETKTSTRFNSFSSLVLYSVLPTKLHEY